MFTRTALTAININLILVNDFYGTHKSNKTNKLVLEKNWYINIFQSKKSKNTNINMIPSKNAVATKKKRVLKLFIKTTKHMRRLINELYLRDL